MKRCFVVTEISPQDAWWGGFKQPLVVMVDKGDCYEELEDGYCHLGGKGFSITGDLEYVLYYKVRCVELLPMA